MKISLFQLTLRKKAVIKNINTDKVTKERLHSFGLIKGVEIAFVRNTPLGCPKIYKCFNTLIAIRDNITKQVEVELKND